MHVGKMGPSYSSNSSHGTSGTDTEAIRLQETIYHLRLSWQRSLGAGASPTNDTSFEFTS